MALLEVKDLKLSFQGNEILRGMNLSLEAGAVHALVGPNGAGKTTLAYSIMGLPGYEPEGGDIIFAGSSIRGLSIDQRARMGLALAWQEPARFEGISVRQFLAAGAANQDHLGRALESVALNPDEYLDRHVDESLSGGERKRIELASIAVMEPKLLIMDEPDSGVDVAALNAIFALLDKLRDYGHTIMLVTHSKEVLGHADTATLMCCGKMVDQGKIKRIKQYFEGKCIPCPIHNPDLVRRQKLPAASR